MKDLPLKKTSSKVGGRRREKRVCQIQRSFKRRGEEWRKKGFWRGKKREQ